MALQDIKNVFIKNNTVKVIPSATIEYNMNSMIDNLSVYYPKSLEQYYPTELYTESTSSGVTTYTATTGGTTNIFKKIFPINSVIKPFRPSSSGIKYYLPYPQEHQGSSSFTKDSKDTASTGASSGANKFYSPRALSYPANSPRLYYPGANTYYKYWVGPKDRSVEVNVKYVHSSSTVVSAYANGSSAGSEIIYTTEYPHGFLAGQVLSSMSGVGTGYNFSSDTTIYSIKSDKSFSILKSSSGTLSPVNSVTGTATLKTATKPALANKFVIKFEKFHGLPTTYTATITKSDNTTVVIGPATPPSNGNAVIYLSGGVWYYGDGDSLITSATTFDSPISVKSIKVEAVKSTGVIGIIEVSARWIKDISSDILGYSESKEASLSTSDILPVGMLTANSLKIDLVKYNQSKIMYVPFDRSLTAFDPDATYLDKYAEIKMYLNVYHAAAETVSGSYDKVLQGIYYVDSWSVSEHGEVSVSCLDSAKYLMETFTPEMLCMDYPVTAIIRRILDSVGFTSYNFNLATSENSVPFVKYFWTEENRSVWDTIQELCRDIQMNGYFDNNGILQFKSRDYTDSLSSSQWTFTYAQDGETLPNIISYSQQEIPSANKVTVYWKSPILSTFTGSSGAREILPNTQLGAGALLTSMTDSSYDPISIDLRNITANNQQMQTLYNFQGYLLIDDEIIEYDAIGYQYEPLESESVVSIWVQSDSDINKYRALAKVGFKKADDPVNTAYFKPNGLYRIKTRGALGTVAKAHKASAADFFNGWTGVPEVSWT